MKPCALEFLDSAVLRIAGIFAGSNLEIALALMQIC